MSRAAKNQGSSPKPIETDSTVSRHNLIQGTSRDDQEIFNELLGFLDKRIQDETNPRRRESIQLCQNFVKEHGYPEEDYYLYA